MTRQQVLDWVRTQYGTEPDCPWPRYPDNQVLRHAGGKWYGLIMSVPREKLGLAGTESVDVLNLKCDPLLSGSLRQSPGILPAYHMNKGAWISVLLDGTVDADTVCPLIDLSYGLTAPKAKPSRRRG